MDQLERKKGWRGTSLQIAAALLLALCLLPDMASGEGSQESVPNVTFIELGSIKCIPCKMMQPVMAEIEEEYKDKVLVVFYDISTEKGKAQAEKYGIRLIPTQIFLDEKGNEFFRHEGFFPKEEIVKVLRQGGVE